MGTGCLFQFTYCVIVSQILIDAIWSGDDVERGVCQLSCYFAPSWLLT